jgi:hypothetical protein
MKKKVVLTLNKFNKERISDLVFACFKVSKHFFSQLSEEAT